MCAPADRLDAYDFDLPDALIALRPARPRTAARLLVAPGAGEAGRPPIDSTVAELARWLRPGDHLVFNDTRVIPARLFGTRERPSTHGSGRAEIEVTLILRASAAEWVALARPAKRLAPGDEVRFEGLSARVLEREGPEVRLRFALGGEALDRAIGAAGVMPLPPYIARRRAADAQDRDDYQPVLAARDGAVASPTASLHFDRALLESLAAAGIGRTTITLHVGPGTFLPVATDRIAEHRMHAERGEITADAAARINAARAAGGRVVAVGTTVLRLLESAVGPERAIGRFSGETDIFIRPGGPPVRSVDALMTNFHLPRSTLFMLTAALMGRARMQALYAHAIRERYRFYSYGDSSLLIPEG